MNSITIAQPTQLTMAEPKQRLVVLCCAVLLSSGVANAQAPASISAEVTQAYTAVKTNILRSAERMPAENYGFKPTPETRTFAEVLDHVADSQIRTCGAVAGEEKPASAAGKVAKEEVTTALNDAFAECDKAYGSLSDANAGNMVATLRGHRSKLGALTGNLAHDNEQYGVLTVYLRLKGVVPPSSDKPSSK